MFDVYGVVQVLWYFLPNIKKVSVNNISNPVFNLVIHALGTFKQTQLTPQGIGL